MAGKGFEPEVMMRTLQSLLTGIAYDELPEGELLATEGEDGPWILQLSEGLRDALADAQPSRLPVVAEQWVATEEFWDEATAAEVLPFLGEITALAGRARPAGERLYCWMCLSSRLTRWWRGAALLNRVGCCALSRGAEVAVAERKGPPSRENAAC